MPRTRSQAISKINFSATPCSTFPGRKGRGKTGGKTRARKVRRGIHFPKNVTRYFPGNWRSEASTTGLFASISNCDLSITRRVMAQKSLGSQEFPAGIWPDGTERDGTSSAGSAGKMLQFLCFFMAYKKAITTLTPPRKPDTKAMPFL